MSVDEKRAKYTTMYGGKTYYFCSLSDKSKFDSDPKKYIKT
jgi:YHS domain-containing protein